MESSVWAQAGMLALALSVKGGLFFLYHRMYVTRNAKHAEIPYAVLKKGTERKGAKKIIVTGGCGFLGRYLARNAEAHAYLMTWLLPTSGCSIFPLAVISWAWPSKLLKCMA